MSAKLNVRPFWYIKFIYKNNSCFSYRGLLLLWIFESTSSSLIFSCQAQKWKHLIKIIPIHLLHERFHDNPFENLILFLCLSILRDNWTVHPFILTPTTQLSEISTSLPYVSNYKHSNVLFLSQTRQQSFSSIKF